MSKDKPQWTGDELSYNTAGENPYTFVITTAERAAQHGFPMGTYIPIKESGDVNHRAHEIDLDPHFDVAVIDFTPQGMREKQAGREAAALSDGLAYLPALVDWLKELRESRETYPSFILAKTNKEMANIATRLGFKRYQPPHRDKQSIYLIAYTDDLIDVFDGQQSRMVKLRNRLRRLVGTH